MVIAVNTRLLLKNKFEGIGWFTYETLRRITGDHPEHEFIFLFDRPYDSSFIFSGNVKPIVLGPPTRHPILWHYWFNCRIPKILKKYKADIFLSPDGYLSLRTNVPQLAVIHDINFFHRPKDLPLFTSYYYNHYFPKFARRAHRLATVSDYSKNDIAKSFNLNPDNIDVVYSGSNTMFTALPLEEIRETRNKYTQGQPYFLFIGALHPRKNVEGLLEAFDRYKSKTGLAEKLVVVGGQMFKTGTIYDVWSWMQHRQDVIFTGRISTEELRQILGSALSLTFVPFFEGFGLPVVEAMSASIPVICSNTTSLPEVGGDAAVYVDPANVEEIASAMEKISSDEELRKKLVERGNEQHKKFSWDKSADKLWESIETTVASVQNNRLK
ncbi:MAG: glycosyltransferase family 4 protein [Prolixibacteraceae bacterium]|nr:glycosyltransferase family 4 protein [Prolixibacteraceae bacterium]